jgi:hypothetical protein
VPAHPALGFVNAIKIDLPAAAPVNAPTSISPAASSGSDQGVAAAAFSIPGLHASASACPSPLIRSAAPVGTVRTSGVMPTSGSVDGHRLLIPSEFVVVELLVKLPPLKSLFC